MEDLVLEYYCRPVTLDFEIAVTWQGQNAATEDENIKQTHKINV